MKIWNFWATEHTCDECQNKMFAIQIDKSLKELFEEAKNKKSPEQNPED
jgi:hypothetical protein